MHVPFIKFRKYAYSVEKYAHKKILRTVDFKEWFWDQF